MARQIRAARSLLGWEQNDLAQQSGVAISTIRRLEALKDAPLGANFATIERLRSAFEEAGIEFLGNPCPGVRLTGGERNVAIKTGRARRASEDEGGCADEDRLWTDGPPVGTSVGKTFGGN
ncbi:MAG: hypothetical protein FWD68_09595 [Alphaproteobacteria bacterium]|nr:hypothetical protein [Alphaproteobacteria bacterium]